MEICIWPFTTIYFFCRHIFLKFVLADTKYTSKRIFYLMVDQKLQCQIGNLEYVKEFSCPRNGMVACSVGERFAQLRPKKYEITLPGVHAWLA